MATRALMAIAAIAIAACVGTSPAIALDPVGKPAKQKSSRKKTFIDRLNAGEIAFTNMNLPPAPASLIPPGQRLMSDPLLYDAAADVLKKLIAVHERRAGPVTRLPFAIVDSEDFNCSVPAAGGRILCTSGAISTVMKSDSAKNGESRLAFLLAHELAHVTIASHRDRFAKSEKLKKDFNSAGVLGALAAVAAISDYKSSHGKITVTTPADAGIYFWNAAIAGMELGELIDNVVAPSWGQDDEDEADAYALVLMREAGYDTGQAAPLLKSVEAHLVSRNQGGGIMQSMLREGARSAATRAIMTKGDKFSTILGGITGVMKGFTAATGHYHRSPGKRAEACAALAGDHVEEQTAMLERERLASLAAAMGGAQLLNASYTVPAPAEMPAVKGKGAKGGKKTAKTKGKAVKSAPKSNWELFLERDWQFREYGLEPEIRTKVVAKDNKGAIAMCPKAPRSADLKLTCAMAHIGEKKNVAAAALLKSIPMSADADTENLRLAARLQASLGDYPAALVTIRSGIAKFPDGSLYPDEMLVRVASGDLAGAKAAGKTCQEKTQGSIKQACTSALETLAKETA